jgi:hypothetical protein
VESPWWGLLTVGATLAGTALAHTFNLLNARREHQFKREEAELERQSKRQDVRRNLYARFIALCRRIVADSTVDHKYELSDLVAEIELVSTGELFGDAFEIQQLIAQLPRDHHEYDSDLDQAIDDFADSVKRDLGLP